MRRNFLTGLGWTWVAFIAAIVLTGIGAVTGTPWVVVLGLLVSLGLIVVNGYRSSKARTGQTYSSKGSLFEDEDD